MATCQNPECEGSYKRTRPWQKFCSSTCRASTRNKELKTRYVGPTAVKVVDSAMEWFEAGGTFEQEEALRRRCAAYYEERLRGENDG